MDNGKDESKSDNASKKKALAEDKAKSVRGIHHGGRERHWSNRTHLHNTVESGKKSTAVEAEQPCNSVDKGISKAAYKI